MFLIRVLFNQRDFKKSKFILYPLSGQSPKFHLNSDEYRVNEGNRIEWTWRSGNKLHTEVYEKQRLKLAYDHPVFVDNWRA